MRTPLADELGVRAVARRSRRQASCCSTARVLSSGLLARSVPLPFRVPGGDVRGSNSPPPSCFGDMRSSRPPKRRRPAPTSPAPPRVRQAEPGVSRTTRAMVTSDTIARALRAMVPGLCHHRAGLYGKFLPIHRTSPGATRSLVTGSCIRQETRHGFRCTMMTAGRYASIVTAASSLVRYELLPECPPKSAGQSRKEQPAGSVSDAIAWRRGMSASRAGSSAARELHGSPRGDHQGRSLRQPTMDIARTERRKCLRCQESVRRGWSSASPCFPPLQKERSGTKRVPGRVLPFAQ